MEISDVDRGPRLLSICTGIGGLDLGVGLALPGARTVCMVEGEAACVELLASRMEDGGLHPAPIWTNARTFDGRPWRGRVHGIVAGYPCQPFSVAGKRRGADDPRHLWPEILRIACEVGPEFLFLENVAGHIRLGLDRVLGDLAEVGFDAEWTTVRASDVGAPHRRERVFILAYRRGGGLERIRQAYDIDGCDALRHDADGCDQAVAYASEPRLALPRLGGQRELGKEDSQRMDDRPELDGGELAAAERQPDERRREPGVLHGSSEQVEGEVGQRQRSRRPIDGRLQADAWPPGPEGDWSGISEHLWPATQSELRGVADGLPGRVDRLRALGNAVVPQQAALALRQLISRIER